jgi:fibronectin type 3 domain-containing protein
MQARVIANSYSDWDVQAGESYLYVVTSVSPKNGESPFSGRNVLRNPYSLDRPRREGV